MLADSARTLQVGRGRVTFLYAAPALCRLVAVVEGSLVVLSLPDLAVLPTAGANKLRGLSAVCVNSNPSQDNPFSVELCVAKAKQCQLALLTLTEERLAVGRTRDTAEPVSSLAMDGLEVCCALASQYVVYNMASGGVTELFPRDPASPAPASVTHVARREFLVLGPGNLGMFVSADGVAGRPPIQWPDAFSHFAVTADWVVGQGAESVAVFSLADQQLQQSVQYSGARWLGWYDLYRVVLCCTLLP